MARLEFSVVPATKQRGVRVGVFVEGEWFRRDAWPSGDSATWIVHLSLDQAETALTELAAVVAAIKAGEDPTKPVTSE